MNKIKIKYCGLKTLTDVESAVEAQVDAIGLVFVKNSSRYINIEDAVQLTAAAKHSGLLVVALFADHQAGDVKQVVDAIEPDILQFHGRETAAYCEQFKCPYWKAIPMLDIQDFQAYMQEYSAAEAFLLDAFGSRHTGGSGKSFQWFKLPEKLLPKLILAGGIDASNVSNAIASTGAQYIDTSSGIESTPGVKSKTKMLALADHIRVIEQSIKQNK